MKSMFDCYHCGDRHHVNDFCATGPLGGHVVSPCGAVTESPDTEHPGGWLVKNDAGGWDWVARRIAATAALTEGRAVYDVTLGKLTTQQEPV